METRFALESEKQSIRQLWEYSFTDNKENVDYYFDKRYNPANSYVITDKNRFVGALQLNPYKMKVGEDVEDVSYVIGVSIEPEFRGLGYSTTLLKNALNELYTRGENVSLLMPIDTNIYLKYGFINTFARHSYAMNLRDIAHIKTDCLIERVKTISDEVYEELFVLYSKASVSKRASIYRTKEYFVNKLEELHVDNGELYVIRKNGVATGYFMFIARYDNEKALVLEAVFDDICGLNCIFAFMRSHITQTSSIEMNFVDHKAFEIASKFSNRYEINKKHFMMARVINAKYILAKVFETALECRILSDCEWDMLENKIVVKVTDNIICANNSLFTIEYDGSQIQVSKVKSGKAKMEIGIPELTQLYMRSAKLSNMQKYENLVINDKNLESLLSIYDVTKSSYINDFI